MILGNVARQERNRQQHAAPAKHTYSNDDVKPATAGATDKNTAEAAGKDDKDISDADSEKESSDQLIAEVKSLKPAIAAKQEQYKRGEEMIAKIHARGEVCWAQKQRYGRSDCDVSEELQQEMHQLDGEIKQLNSELEEKQEQLRKMGFGNSVYDPD